jgi:hypothetical protein
MLRRALPFVALLALFLASCVGTSTSSESPRAALSRIHARSLEELEKRTFQFFWETANPENGLVPDRYPTPSFASIAAVGYALTAYPIGVERGYVTRAAARDRVLATLRFLKDAPQGPEPEGMAGYKGFYYHFIVMGDGKRFSNQTELSTVDTALLMGGVLFCEGYFDRADASETELRSLAEELYRRVDWTWAANAEGAVVLGWTPEHGYHPMHWRGYNEGMIVYLLGLGSPTHPLPDGAWGQWTESYPPQWRTEYGQTYLSFPPLFGHQFSHIWVDFRSIQDAFMREKGIDYFENSRRATYAQQEYAIQNPMHWTGYGSKLFGVSASDGPANYTAATGEGPKLFRRYAARGLGGASTYDDGTLSPAALVSSVVFAPEIVLPAVAEMQRKYGAGVWSTYGYVDGFNPSFDFDVPLAVGRRIPGLGWFDGDYIGIDQGSTIGMIENYRSELVWRVMRNSPYLRRGLERAGFQGGWLGASK